MLPQQQFELNHKNFLSIVESRNMLKNMKKRLDNSVNQILTTSVLDNADSNHIRMLAAKANGMQELINLIENDPKSIA